MLNNVLQNANDKDQGSSIGRPGIAGRVWCRLSGARYSSFTYLLSSNNRSIWQAIVRACVSTRAFFSICNVDPNKKETAESTPPLLLYPHTYEKIQVAIVNIVLQCVQKEKA
jgi:hypothetical protein